MNTINLFNPHPQRRQALLKKYPEIKQLFGHDKRTKYVAIGMLTLQLSLAFLLPALAWWQLLLVSFFVGGTLNHGLAMAIHEASHNLLFKQARYNKLCAILLNLPLLIPMAISFRHYHLAHHQHLGIVGEDTDLPTSFEERYCRRGMGKYLWFFVFHLIYIIRPVLVKREQINRWHVLNSCIQVIFITLVCLLKPTALLYLVLSVLLGLSLFHPLSGHYLAEHFIFTPHGQASFSYYGPLNRFMFNVGYHNEHHDFPSVSGFNLKRLHHLAQTEYAPLVSYSSWPALLVQFICSQHMGPHKRHK